MRKIAVTVLMVLLLCGQAVAGGGLDGFLSNLNVQAQTDLNGFAIKLSSQFGIPGAQVRAVINTVKEPADAFMVLQLGQMSRQPTEQVMRVYETKRGSGWGVIAKSLGIKPGSAEFHALKRGDFTFSGEPARGGEGPGKGRGKGKGHNR